MLEEGLRPRQQAPSREDEEIFSISFAFYAENLRWNYAGWKRRKTDRNYSRELPRRARLHSTCIASCINKILLIWAHKIIFNFHSLKLRFSVAHKSVEAWLSLEVLKALLLHAKPHKTFHSRIPNRSKSRTCITEMNISCRPIPPTAKCI